MSESRIKHISDVANTLAHTAYADFFSEEELSATQRPRTIHNVGGFSPSRPVQPFAELRTPPIGFPETLSEEHGSPRDFAGQRSLPATHLEH